MCWLDVFRVWSTQPIMCRRVPAWHISTFQAYTSSLYGLTHLDACCMIVPAANPLAAPAAAARLAAVG